MNCSIVITNHNGVQNLRRCLPAVLAAAKRSGCCDEVIVVDDCSTDDSVEFLHREHPSVRVVSMEERGSFLGAANEGFRQAVNDRVALLSNDMAPEEDFLTRLLPHLEDPNVFAAHATLAGPEGDIQSERALGRFVLGNLKILNTAKRDSGLSRALLVPAEGSRFSLYCGGCALFDRRKFQDLGGYDPIYFPFFWEDVDLCFRAWSRGWKTLWEPDCKVYHHHLELGTIHRLFDRDFVKDTERRNRLLFIWSHLDSLDLWAAHLAYLALSLGTSWVLGRFGFYRSFIEALRLREEVRKRRRRRPVARLRDREIFETVAGDLAGTVQEGYALEGDGTAPS